MDDETVWQINPDGVIELGGGGVDGKLRPWILSDMRKMTPEMHVAWLELSRVSRVLPRMKEVCICGHSATAHLEETMMCRPTRIECTCEVLIPVLKAEDLRDFVYKTRGIREHALTLGIARAESRGHAWEWLPGEPRCPGCNRVADDVHPIIINTTPNSATKGAIVLDVVEFEKVEGYRRRVRDSFCCSQCLIADEPPVARALGLM